MHQLLDNVHGLPGAVQYSARYPMPDTHARILFAWGNFNDATVSVEISPNGREWFPLQTFTRKGWMRLELAVGVTVRVGVNKGSQDTAISASIV